MNNNDSLSATRQDYQEGVLSLETMQADPIKQFRIWLDQASKADIIEPNAMNIATISEQGVLSSRMVLLKGIDPRGFVFFTNYESRKADEIAHSMQVALCFWWGSLERQVRVEGYAEKVSAAESDEYFNSRPRGSRIGAIASAQSSVLDSYAELEQKVAEVEKKYADSEDIPRPDNWGGYLIVPNAVEFWQGRPSRLHDRFHYRREAEQSWKIERLSP